VTTAPSAAANGSFRHEALLYAGSNDFVDRVGSFVQEGVALDEPALVVVDAAKIDLLRSRLGSDAASVRFADMATVGRNPARIIPEWRAFVAEHAGSGRPFRGVGEPVDAKRSADELAECERHESLLNLAFADGAAWWLLCPYDTTTLSTRVLNEAERNHPFVAEAGDHRKSPRFRGLADARRPFDRPLPEPEVEPDQMSFGLSDLGAVRRFGADHASRFGLSPERVQHLVIALDEVAANSVRHGGGRGVLRIWPNGRSLVCEISDEGRIDDPLAGRSRPEPDQLTGFGLWTVNQLCDLVQVRAVESGSVVRLHMARA
jgi:anti-sigma regulatory factor (Ser/Thr protein kinase)